MKWSKTFPNIEDVLLNFINFIGDDYIVGHNVSFDINFLKSNCETIGIKNFNPNFVDTIRICRKLFPKNTTIVWQMLLITLAFLFQKTMRIVVFMTVK
ncbi:3'-5' exonuclease [Pseudoramibacter alactolyticus]